MDIFRRQAVRGDVHIIGGNLVVQFKYSMREIDTAGV